LILGGGITALGAMRNLGRSGIRLFVIGREPPGYLRSSRWFRPPPGIRADRWPAEDLSELLHGMALEGAVLIPCADDWQLRTAELPPALGSRFPSSGPPADAVRNLIDKLRFAEVLERYDVPHPRTMPIACQEDLRGVDDDLLARAFFKARDSQRFVRQLGVKAFRCRGREEARVLLERITDSGLGIVLQEYIPGPPTAHTFVDGFVDREGLVRALFTRRRLRMYPQDFGNSTLMESIPPSEIQPAIDCLRHLLEVLRYRGVFSAEFKQDERDGLFKLLEVNCRQWWYVEFAARCGVNVTRMAYRDALGLPVQTAGSFKTGRRCVHPDYDRRACRALQRANQLSFWEWGTSSIGADDPVFCWDDPMPAAANAFGRLARRFKGSFDS